MWTELTEKLKGKPIREIFKQIVDQVGVARGPDNATSRYKVPTILSLIEASDDFTDESDVEAVCSDLRHHDHIVTVS
jgi:hypothetical protein